MEDKTESGDRRIFLVNYAHCFRHWEEDVRLMVLILVSSFIILSLISIISITTCVLSFSDHDMDQSQNMEYLIKVRHMIPIK